MSDSAPMISPGEARWERFRQKAGLVVGPLTFVVLWLWPIPSLTPEAHRLLAVTGLTVIFWVSEAIPLPAAALLGPALCVVVGVRPPLEVFKSFAHPIIFLFLGSFLLAEAMVRHGLNQRIAYSILGWRLVGHSPSRLLWAFGGTTGFLSLWLSNTATTAMMYPIALAILRAMARQQSELTGRETDFRHMPFSAGLMLMTAFAASVGGLGTPVGTPPNLIGLGHIENLLGVRIRFFQWVSFGLPLATVLVVFLGWHFRRVCPHDPGLLRQGGSWIHRHRAELGRWRAGEINVLAAFWLTVSLWILPGVVAVAAGPTSEWARWLERHLPESTVALMGALVLFVLPQRLTPWEPTLAWNDAQRIDWGTILLFGGGLALGDLMFQTGLAEWAGRGLAGMFQTQSAWGLTVLFTAVAIVVSETTSNAASAAMVVPVAIAVAQAAGVPPLGPALAACLGSSLGFMLPVSTPPNAIVYGSGCVPITVMLRHGLWLDVVGFVVIVLTVNLWVPMLTRIE